MSRLNVDQIYSRTGTGTPALREMPCFDSALSQEQTGLTSGTITLTQMQSTLDTNSWFDNDNYRYNPQIAGYYQISCGAWGSTTSYTTDARIITYLYKNGVSVGTIGYATFWSNANALAAGSKLIYLNGSTDYIDFRAAITASGSPSIITAGSQFSGFLVRPD